MFFKLPASQSPSKTAAAVGKNATRRRVSRGVISASVVDASSRRRRRRGLENMCRNNNLQILQKCMYLEQRMTLKRDSSVPNFFSPASNRALASLRALRRSIVLPSGRLACSSATSSRFKLPDVSDIIDSSSFLLCPATSTMHIYTVLGGQLCKLLVR